MLYDERNGLTKEKRMKYLLIISLLFINGCSSTLERAPAPAEETETPKQETKPELTQEEIDAIDQKLEKLKKEPIKKLIENAGKASTNYERKASREAIQTVLDRKLLVYLGKEFPDTKDVLAYKIYNSTGEENYSGLELKDLFMLYFGQNPNTGSKIEKQNLDMKRNKKDKTVKILLQPPGAREMQEFYFKIFNDKLILSGYRSGTQLNPTGYEYVVSEIFDQLSCKEMGYIPRLDFINQKLVDSIK